jgi:putative RNA 2'-phosphotransferase
MKDKIEISKFISLLLRHKPEVGNVTLDKNGWCNVNDLIIAVNNRYNCDDFSMENLEDIVSTDNKKRYSFNDDKTLIRANQGHSVNVDVNLKECEPPKVLYHGTAKKSVDGIEKYGIKPMSRLYVHLSKDIDTAIKVGSRHGKVVVYKIDIEKMIKDGYKFYISENDVWLTKIVPVEYISMVDLNS